LLRLKGISLLVTGGYGVVQDISILVLMVTTQFSAIIPQHPLYTD